MMDILTQLRMPAQGDGEGFANLLFIIVVLVLWAVGGLIRATRKGAAQRQGTGAAGGAPRQGETWQERLARKAQEMQRAAEAAQRMRRVEVKPAPRSQAGQPAAAPGPVMQTPTLNSPEGTIVTRPGRGGESILVYERKERQGGTTREELAAQQQEARDAVSAARYSTVNRPPKIEAKIELGEPVLRPAAEIAGAPPGWVFDYRDPDAFRKAILHYEILGKPVGQRDPFEQSTGF